MIQPTKPKSRRKRKKQEEEGTAQCEWCLIIAVLSYKIYISLPEPIKDRYSSTETAYLKAGWGGISNNNHPVEGVTDTELDLDEFKLFFFTREAPKGENLTPQYVTKLGLGLSENS